VHNVSQWPNLRHLAEPLGGAVGLLEGVSFKEKPNVRCTVLSFSPAPYTLSERFGPFDRVNF